MVAPARASTKLKLATLSSSFQVGVGMSEKVSAEYQLLCNVEMEAEERALNATKAIRERWHVEDGIAKGVPSQEALDAEADLWQRVAVLRKKRHAWVAKLS